MVKSFKPLGDRAGGVGDLDGERALLGLAVGQADVREYAAEHLAPGGEPVLRGVIGAVDRDVSVAGPDEVEDRLLLARGEFELVVAAVGVDDDQVVLAHGRGFQDRGVLADRDLEPAGVLQGAGQVQCLVAVSVMLALAAREQEDLGAVGRFLLGQGRLRRTSKTRSRTRR